MGGKTAVAIGLITGVLAGAAAIGGLLLVVSGPVARPAAPSPAATAVPLATNAPTPTPGLPASPAPVSSAAPSAAASPSPAPTDAAFGIGLPAPALVVTTTGGTILDLASLRGKPVWVNFMATWCPSCQDEMPLMAGFAARYADAGLVVLAVDVREDAASVKAFTKALGVTFPVGLDTDGTAQAAWGALALPTHFWIDAGGVVRDGALGAIGPDVMAVALSRILPGVEPAP
ncbi:MAG: TlpA disulfide reductase family protein [Chloroflexota bacterium]